MNRSQIQHSFTRFRRSDRSLLNYLDNKYKASTYSERLRYHAEEEAVRQGFNPPHHATYEIKQGEYGWFGDCDELHLSWEGPR